MAFDSSSVAPDRQDLVNDSGKLIDEACPALLGLAATAMWQSPIAVCATDVSTLRLIAANPAFERMTGFCAQELIGRTVEELNLWVDHNRHQQVREALAQSNEVSAYEVTYRRKDGSHGFGIASFVLTDTAIGRLAITFVVDITAQLSSQERLARSDANVAALIDNLPDAVWSVDRDLCVIACNRVFRDSMSRLFGHEVLPGFDLKANLPALDKEFWDEAYARAFAGESHRYDQLQSSPVGLRRVELSINPIWHLDSVYGAVVSIRDVTETRKAEERSNLQALVIEHSNDAIVIVTQSGIVTNWNKSAEGLFGWTEAEAIGSSIRTIVKLGWSEEQYQEELSQLEQHGCWESELELTRRDGTSITVVAFVMRLRGENSEDLGMAAIYRDVSHERVTTRALLRSEQNYRALFEHNPSPMWLVDPSSMRYIRANKASQELLGYTEEQFEGMSPYDIIDPKEFDRLRNAASPFLNGAQREYGCWHVRDVHGASLVLNVHSHMIEFDAKPVQLVVAIDVTKRFTAERELHEAHERFALAAQAVNSVIYEWDVASGRCERSIGQLTVLGYPIPDTSSNNFDWWYSRLHPDDRERVTTVVRSSIAEGRPFESEYRFRHAEGHYIRVLDRGVVVVGGDGAPVRIVGSMQDVTRQRSMEAELEHERRLAFLARDKAEEMNRLKSTFLANMSHEIRTPMTAILGFASVLEDSLSEPELLTYARLIRQGGERLLATINSILDLAKVESNRVDLILTPTDVVEETRHLVDSLQPLVRAADNTPVRRICLLTHDFGALRPHIDRNAFGQILTNLIGNAVKFSDDGDVVVAVAVTAEEIDRNLKGTELWAKYQTSAGGLRPQYHVIVRDRGIGIAPEFLESIFEEFKQESAGDERKFEGTGLGLTISRRLVEAMGGWMEVRSLKGEGSVFIVSLPLEPVN